MGSALECGWSSPSRPQRLYEGRPRRFLPRGAGVFVCVGSGEEALVAIAQAPPDVLLSDISMPDMDGCELLRRVRRLPPEQGGKVPAAAITAHAEGSSVLSVLEAGFDLHVPKPLSPDELVEVVLRLAHRKGA